MDSDDAIEVAGMGCGCITVILWMLLHLAFWALVIVGLLAGLDYIGVWDVFDGVESRGAAVLLR